MNDLKKAVQNEEEEILYDLIPHGIAPDDLVKGNIKSGDKVIPRKKKLKDSEAKRTFKPEGKGLFGKLYLMPLRTLYNDLSYREMATLSVLVTFASYQDCILKVHRKYCDAKDLCEELHENYDSFRKVITSLIKKDVLKKVERQSDTYQNVTKQCLVLNPYICFRGTTVNPDVYEMFFNTKWAHISDEYNETECYEEDEY